MSAVFWVAALVATVAAARGTWSPCGLSMISAINPMTERARGHRYALTCAWFVAGALGGGLVLGAAGALGAGLVGAAGLGSSSGSGSGSDSSADSITTAAVAVAALVCLASDLGVGVRLPGHPRQVDETWLSTYRRWVYAVGFGAQIGVGFATYIMTAATYLVVVLMAATGSPSAALLVGAWFGLVRGAAVVLAAGARSPGALMTLHRRLDRAAPVSLIACEATCAAVAVWAGWSASGLAGAAGAMVLVVGVAAWQRPSGRRALAAPRAPGSGLSVRQEENSIPNML